MPRKIENFIQMFSSISKKFGISAMNEYNTLIVDLSTFTSEQALNQIKTIDKQPHLANVIYYYKPENLLEDENFYQKLNEIVAKSSKACYFTNILKVDSEASADSTNILLKIFYKGQEFDIQLSDMQNGSYNHYEIMFTNNFYPDNNSSSKKTQTQPKTCNIILDRNDSQSEFSLTNFKQDFNTIDNNIAEDNIKFTDQIEKKVIDLVGKFSNIHDCSIDIV